MNTNQNHNIHSPSDCVTEKTLFDYIDNKLTQKERHVVEKHLLDCELCSDALEGLELVKDRGRITLIKEEINKRILAGTKEETKVVAFNYKRAFSIAATIALLVVGVFLFKQMSLKESTMSGDMAQLKESEEASPALAPPPPPPPPSTLNNVTPEAATGESFGAGDPGGDISGIAAVAEEEITEGPVNATVLDQEVAKAEEKKPEVFYKSEGNGENKNEVPADEITTTSPSFGATSKDASISQTDDRKSDKFEKSNSAPKSTGTYDYAKDSKTDGLKKAEDKAEGGSGNVTYNWSTPDANNKQQTNDSRTTTIAANSTTVTKTTENMELSKEADKGKSNGVYRSENKPVEVASGKSKKSPNKNSRENERQDNIAGAVGYEPESVIKEKERLKEAEQTVVLSAKVAAAADSAVAFESVLVSEPMPEYPGGDAALNKFITTNFNYPKDQQKTDPPLTNKIYVQFTVASDGTIKNPKILKGINTTLDNEAIRVVKLMPKWKPVQQNGKPVSTVVNLPIKLEFK